MPAVWQPSPPVPCGSRGARYESRPDRARRGRRRGRIARLAAPFIAALDVTATRLEPHSHIRRLEFMLMHLRPLHDRIIVERLEETPHSGAILIPDSAKEKPQQGKVLAAGLGKNTKDSTRPPPDVKTRDTLPFGKISG